MEIGDALEAADLNDIELVTGSRPAGWLTGEAQLEAFGMADAASRTYDVVLLELFHKRLLRLLMLNGPAGSAITVHHPVQRFG